MKTDDTKRKRSGRKTLYTTAKAKYAALRERQARYNARRAKLGKNVDIFLPTDLYEKMAAAAKAEGVSRNEYVKRLIAAAVELQIEE